MFGARLGSAWQGVVSPDMARLKGEVKGYVQGGARPGGAVLGKA